MWNWTPAAAAYQKSYVATLVATGQWNGPTPSDGVLDLAARMKFGTALYNPKALALAA